MNNTYKYFTVLLIVICSYTIKAQEVDLTTGVKIKVTISEGDYPQHWNSKNNNVKAVSLDPSEVNRSIRIIKKVLGKYPKELIRNNLKEIYLLKSLENQEPKTTDIIYLVNEGESLSYSDEYIEYLFHHYFTLILLENHSKKFDKTKWMETNGMSYKKNWQKYLSNSQDSRIFDPRLFKKGYLYPFAISGFEVDVISMSNNIFNPTHEFINVLKQHKKLKTKYDLLVSFYASLDQSLTPQYFDELNSRRISQIKAPLIVFKEKEIIVQKTWSTSDSKVKSKPFEEKNLIRAKRIIKQALDKYPEEFVNTNLDNIYLLKHLEINGVEYGGTIGKDALYIVIDDLKSNAKDQTVEATIHHEFSHLLYYKYQNYFNQKKWIKINSNSYGVGGRNAILESKSSVVFQSSLHKKGFLHSYATSAIIEDMASIVEYLFQPNNQYLSAVSKYKKLKKKQQLLIEFYHSLDKVFTQEYFEHIKTEIVAGTNYQILYKSDENTFPESWKTKEVDPQAVSLDKNEIKRSDKIIVKAIEKYPNELIVYNLKKVYVLDSIEFYGKNYISSNLSTGTIYLTNTGTNTGQPHLYSDFYIENLFHLEFVNILFENFFKY